MPPRPFDLNEGFPLAAKAISTVIGVSAPKPIGVVGGGCSCFRYSMVF